MGKNLNKRTYMNDFLGHFFTSKPNLPPSPKLDIIYARSLIKI